MQYRIPPFTQSGRDGDFYPGSAVDYLLAGDSDKPRDNKASLANPKTMAEKHQLAIMAAPGTVVFDRCGNTPDS